MPHMLRLILAVLLVAAATATCAQESFVAGKDYDGVSPRVPTSVADDKVEVVELFWYGCPHCYAFEPEIAKWLERKADYIEFVRIPAIFARNWEIHARAYYAAEQLGVLEQTHSALFQALHRDRRKLFTVDQIAAFFAEQGVDEAAFRAAYDSFDVDAKTRRAAKLTRDYGISGVPSMIVNGRYRSSAQKAGDFETLLKVVDFLAAKEADR
jgi:thiol:disulfide interchange protein DsbA